MDKIILDSNSSAKKSGIRYLAIAIEIIPLLSIICYSLVVHDYLLIMFIPPLMSTIYLTLGWYLFKGNQYSVSQILTTIILGLYILYIGVAYIYVVQGWTEGIEMLKIGLISGVLINVGLIYRYKKNQFTDLEYRFSLKLLSRIVLFQLILIIMLIKIW